MLENETKTGANKYRKSITKISILENIKEK